MAFTFSKKNIEQFSTYSATTYHESAAYLVTVENIKYAPWSVTGVIPEQQILTAIKPIKLFILIAILFCGGLLLFITSKITRSILANISVIEKGIKEYEIGNLHADITPINDDELGNLALKFNGMGHQLRELLNKLGEEQDIKTQLEFQALKAQVNPHFLYNTLESIKWAAFNRKEYETSNAVDSLINLLRITIKNSEKSITLKEELNYVTDYLNIQKLKYGSYLLTEFDVDYSLIDSKVAGFFIQPFVENSIIHGFDLSKNTGKIIIKCEKQEDNIVITICDNGIGMPQEKINELLNSNKVKNSGFNGLGVAIVNQRLRYYYGNEYSIDIKSIIDQGTTVSFKIPFLE